MQIVKCDENSIRTAIEVLKKGGLIIYPTETMYGAGVDATNASAVQKLTLYKNRPLGKPYSIAVSDVDMAKEYANLNSVALNLFKEFLPGPLTIISQGKNKLTKGVESEDGKIGVRLPDYKFVRSLVEKFGKPITSTSANASYKKRPYSVADILESLSQKQKDLIDLIIDAGTLPRHDPSTVVDTTFDEPVTLRQGEIKFTEKNEILSTSEESTQNLAKEIWQKNEPYYKKRSIVFALQGNMGAGKTQFTKGLAKAMGITELVTSPTFAIENEYGSGSTKLYHFDAWRLENSVELAELGFEKLIEEKAVLSVEWADKVADFIRKYDDEAIIIWINISFTKRDNDRKITWGNL